MKWGRKKQSSATSSRSFLISHVLPSSWITKFKQMRMDSAGKHAKVNKQREKWNYVTANTFSYANDGGGRFYGGDGDAFWRLSFGEESLDGVKSRAVFRPGSCNSDDYDGDLEFLPSTCYSCRSKARRLDGKETVYHARKIRRLPKEVEYLPEVQTCMREKVAEIRTPRIKAEREKKLRKGNRRVSEGKQLDSKRRQYEAGKVRRNTVVKNMYEAKSGKTRRIVEREDFKLAAADLMKVGCISPLNSRDSHLRKIGEGYAFVAENEGNEFPAEIFNHERQKLKENKSRNEEQHQRKSFHISRELQRRLKNSKVRVNSPRTFPKTEICKVKALQEMKKSKLKMKKKPKEKTTEEFQGLEGFAVVKCSYDPQKDFRNSMVEMIKEQNISQPEELEELLACYLTLNSDEYHDLIIRVFRQVWYDLNQACFPSESERMLL